MSLPAIEVSGLSKRYVIQHESRHDNLRDTLHHTARKIWRKLRWGTGFETEEFMALNDVSFSVQPGEVVGIIGRNGAGKSTLLKILSRITEPTAGKITIRGRVASLLEVGTGFHPDLTGRENIFLNGAILGMSRAEIRKKFDEIVAFAEIERFLDTPVKRYSSGMYVRLAFAVAAHLEPDILIVDEVLAVGDAAFQKKCLGKIRDVSSDKGRSVLFVSHNLAYMRQLCSRAILLQQGRLVADGSPALVIGAYSQRDRQPGDYRHIAGDGAARITAIRQPGGGSIEPVFPIFSPVTFELHYETRPGVGRLEFFILIYGDDGECLAASFQGDQGAPFADGAAATGKPVTVSFKTNFAPGRYLVSAGIFDANRQFHDWVELAESFEIVPGFTDGRAFDQRLGRISLDATWTS